MSARSSQAEAGCSLGPPAEEMCGPGRRPGRGAGAGRTRSEAPAARPAPRGARLGGRGRGELALRLGPGCGRGSGTQHVRGRREPPAPLPRAHLPLRPGGASRSRTTAGRASPAPGSPPLLQRRAPQRLWAPKSRREGSQGPRRAQAFPIRQENPAVDRAFQSDGGHPASDPARNDQCCKKQSSSESLLHNDWAHNHRLLCSDSIGEKGFPSSPCSCHRRLLLILKESSADHAVYNGLPQALFHHLSSAHEKSLYVIDPVGSPLKPTHRWSSPHRLSCYRPGLR